MMNDNMNMFDNANFVGKRVVFYNRPLPNKP